MQSRMLAVIKRNVEADRASKMTVDLREKASAGPEKSAPVDKRLTEKR